MKHKDDAGWGGADEDIFPPGMGMMGQGGPWQDDGAFA